MSDIEDHDDDRHDDDGEHPSPPRRKLYDDDEDDEEEEEEEEEDDEPSTKPSTTKHRHKKPRTGLSRFLDIEAEVSSEDEEDGEGAESDSAIDGFISKENDGVYGVGDDLDIDDRHHHARVDYKRRQAERSAEEIARELSDRYSGRGIGGRRFTGELSEIPQRLLMPSVHDASLWQVRVKPGREREIVFSLMRKSLDLEYTAKPMSILSAFQRDSLPGMIYVEAKSSQQVAQACAGLVGVYPSRGIHLVPIDEMSLLLLIKKVDAGEKIIPGTWVRLKRGKYAGDLAQVVDVTENGDEVGVRFVPRIDLNPREDERGLGRKRKKGNDPTSNNNPSARPPQRLFNYEEVLKVYGRTAVSKRGQVYVFFQDTYKDGFIEKDVKLNSIILEDVNPTLDEITMFNSNNPLEESLVDLSIIAEASRKAALAVLQPGDHIEVFQGEQSGVHGIVQEIQGETLTITALGLDLEGQKIDLPARSVRKRFKPGDHVKVMQGKNAGETGLVVAVSDTGSTPSTSNVNANLENGEKRRENTVVTFISDMTMQEVSVFSKDLREAAEVGNTTNIVGEYELHDLVQLDPQTIGVIYSTSRSSFLVLTQHSQSRLVHPHQILQSLRPKPNSVIATDKNSHEIRLGDTMQETENEHRTGRVLHIYQSHFAFLFNRDVAEHGGVFVTRARSLVSVSPKGGVITPGGASSKKPTSDLTKMNPLSAGGASGGGGFVGSTIGRGPRDRLIGAHVVVIKGPHKGYVGIVKDTNGVGLSGVARVELNTGNKVISIEKGKLHRKLPDGRTEPVEGPGATWGRNGGGGGGDNNFNLPMGGRTPGWGASGGGGGRTPGSGGRTPSWGIGAGRTPNPYATGGHQTPAWNVSSKTPNPYAGGGGGQTPAWSAGSKTPNPYAASAAASRGGGRTPNPYASGGGATPGRNAWGGKDSWGSPIPADSGSGIGGWGAEIPASTWAAQNAPTPAFASTPGFAPTPAIPSTPGGNLSSTNTPYSSINPQYSQYSNNSNTYASYGAYAAPTPGMLPTAIGRRANEGPGEYTPPPDWLLAQHLTPHLTSLRVNISGTKLPHQPYLDGLYESLDAHILAASRVADNYEQTALVKVDLEKSSAVTPAQLAALSSTPADRSIPTKFLLPVPPSSQDDTAIVLTGPRQGDKVKLRQRPDSGSPTELVVVESVDAGGNASGTNGTEGGAFWECQKDWMTVGFPKHQI
ncbi:transcription elongation factor spt5 [Lentinula edodes]|uniref:Transcription elongation factor SPT5 n=1 Tax=Lentinula edodes TaxID=5353 RepID=A0A1Q3EK30_LENED|nr:transcription elongation factor spt5 [Lentinula edodes]